MSIGMTMVILAGEIDISVGAQLYCAGAIASEVFLSTRSVLAAAGAAIISELHLGCSMELAWLSLKSLHDCYFSGL